MSLPACAEIVARGDPDRFRATMVAPVAARSVLFPLFAFNLEVARAPWVTAEPMIAEMRLQFWRDALAEIGAGQPPRAHEVAESLDFLDAAAAGLLDALVDARRWDIGTDPFEDEADFDAYLDATSGHLHWVAARALGAGAAAETVVRDAAWALGLANYLRAIPALEARGRVPLLDGRAEAVAALARRGLDRLAAAKAKRRDISGPAMPALFPCAFAGPVLTQAAADPALVAEGRLAIHPLRDRFLVLRLGATARWWP